MFRMKKSKNKNEISKDISNVSVEDPHKHPLICLFDFNKDVEKELKQLRFNYLTASFGSTVKVANQRYEEKLLQLNLDYPNNLHEFDIVMMDMTTENSEDFDAEMHSLNDTSGNKAYALLSAYPEQVFDPRPFIINVVSSEIKDLAEKNAIVIAFCGSVASSEYQFVEITARGASVTSRESYSNHDFYNGFPGSKNRYGRKITFPKEASKLSPLFNQHVDGIEYRSVFNHPNILVEGKYQKDRSFIPLLFNERNEIISYAHYKDKLLVLVFPDIENKASFIASLLKTYLPEIMPDIFPFHGEFGWLDNGEYLLPNEGVLLEQKIKLGIKYEKNLQSIENRLKRQGRSTVFCMS